MAAGGGTKAIIAAFLANAGIAVAKFVGFIFTSSSSMLAESIHSVADAGNQGLLLLGGKKAKKDPSPEHPFGYGRERYFWVFVVAMVLFTLGGLFSLYEGVEKILHPEPIESPAWAFGILSFAIIADSAKDRASILEILRSAASVRRVIHIRTQHIGPEELLVGAKVEFDRDLTFEQLAEAVDAVEQRLRAKVPIAKIIYIEPDIARNSTPPAASTAE